MSHLRPCSACSRHVSSEASRCPFCDGALALDLAPPTGPVRRGRAAAFVAGAVGTVSAAVATASIVACGGAPAQVAAPTDSTMADAGSPVTSTTASAAPPDAAAKLPDYSNIAKPYGAPPAAGLTRLV